MDSVWPNAPYLIPCFLFFISCFLFSVPPLQGSGTVVRTLTRGFIALHPILGVVPLRVPMNREANAIRPVGAWLHATSERIPFGQQTTRNGSNIHNPGLAKRNLG